MKKVNFLFTILLMSISTGVSAEEQVNCGNDYNCYYEQQAKQQKLEKDIERQEEEAFREEQLDLQREQVREVQENRMFMEQQMQEQEADRYEKLPDE